MTAGKKLGLINLLDLLLIQNPNFVALKARASARIMEGRVYRQENIPTKRGNNQPAKADNEGAIITKRTNNQPAKADKEIAKYDSWDNVNKNINVKALFASERQFQQCKRDGVGQTTILKFLGGNELANHNR